MTFFKQKKMGNIDLEFTVAVIGIMTRDNQQVFPINLNAVGNNFYELQHQLLISPPLATCCPAGLKQTSDNRKLVNSCSSRL
jgi:hypothetical protein